MNISSAKKIMDTKNAKMVQKKPDKGQKYFFLNKKKEERKKLGLILEM